MRLKNKFLYFRYYNICFDHNILTGITIYQKRHNYRCWFKSNKYLICG